MTPHRTEFPELGLTLVVDADDRADYVRWEHEDPPWANPFEEDDRADEAGSQPAETP